MQSSDDDDDEVRARAKKPGAKRKNNVIESDEDSTPKPEVSLDWFSSFSTFVTPMNVY